MTLEPSTAPVEIEGYRHGRVPRELRESQMLDVAEQVFCEHGYSGASIEEICRRAGVKRPLFYTYFGGKAGLYIACHQRARAELDARFSAVAAGIASERDRTNPETLRTAFEALSRGYFEFLAASPTRWDMLYGVGAAVSGEMAEEIVSMREQTISLLAEIIRAHVSEEVSDEVVAAYAHAASGIGEQLARWWCRAPEIDIETMATHASVTIWGGLRGLAVAEH